VTKQRQADELRSLPAAARAVQDSLPGLLHRPVHELMEATPVLLALVYVANGTTLACAAGQNRHTPEWWLR
jgi:hypothetical protein